MTLENLGRKGKKMTQAKMLTLYFPNLNSAIERKVCGGLGVGTQRRWKKKH